MTVACPDRGPSQIPRLRPYSHFCGVFSGGTLGLADRFLAMNRVDAFKSLGGKGGTPI